MIGVQRTIIRQCDNLDRLTELNLYIEVMSNSYPDFLAEPVTAFTVAVNDTVRYQLPELIDPEGNDEPEIFLSTIENYEDRYPAFLDFDQETRTLTFTPDVYDGGSTYYFSIVVKEKNSDSVKYPFYATVTVDGDIVYRPCNETQERLVNGGECVDKCLDGQARDDYGVCVNLPCEAGTERINGESACVTECAEGETRNAEGVCTADEGLIDIILILLFDNSAISVASCTAMATVATLFTSMI